MNTGIVINLFSRGVSMQYIDHPDRAEMGLKEMGSTVRRTMESTGWVPVVPEKRRGKKEKTAPAHSRGGGRRGAGGGKDRGAKDHHHHTTTTMATMATIVGLV